MTSTAKILANENIFCCPGQSEGRQAQKTEGGWKINDSVFCVQSIPCLFCIMCCSLCCQAVLCDVGLY